jgi:broad specificity phosphatase PhoE
MLRLENYVRWEFIKKFHKKDLETSNLMFFLKNKKAWIENPQFLELKQHWKGLVIRSLFPVGATRTQLDFFPGGRVKQISTVFDEGKITNLQSDIKKSPWVEVLKKFSTSKEFADTPKFMWEILHKGAQPAKVSIVWVRHGYACHNAVKSLGKGGLGTMTYNLVKTNRLNDARLSDRGLGDVAALGAALKEKMTEEGLGGGDAQVIYTSSILSRTQETALAMCPEISEDNPLYVMPGIGEGGNKHVKEQSENAPASSLQESQKNMQKFFPERAQALNYEAVRGTWDSDRLNLEVGKFYSKLAPKVEQLDRSRQITVMAFGHSGRMAEMFSPLVCGEGNDKKPDNGEAWKMKHLSINGKMIQTPDIPDTPGKDHLRIRGYKGVDMRGETKVGLEDVKRCFNEQVPEGDWKKWIQSSKHGEKV